MIVHEINIFQQRSEQKHSFSHRCNLYHTRNGGCPATLTTDKERSLLLSLKGPHNHPDKSPNTLEKQRKRHRLHTTYTANKPIRVLATEFGVPVDNTLCLQLSRLRKRHRKQASETGMLAATEGELEAESEVTANTMVNTTQ